MKISISPFAQYYDPPDGENVLGNVEDVTASRRRFIEDKPSNMVFLLKNRYQWMNGFILPEDQGIEVGCGNGVSKFFIRCDHFSLTDYTNFEWIDQKVDALHLPYENQSLDFIISSNMIHHLASPARFLTEAQAVLKKNGKLIIQEVWGSVFLRLILKLMRHEGWD